MKIRVWVATNKVGSECSSIIEIDDEDLEGYDEGPDREGEIDEYARHFVFAGSSLWEWGWEPVSQEQST